jgi:RNA polymerase sigma-70 factor, ECF subfamily
VRLNPSILKRVDAHSSAPDGAPEPSSSEFAALLSAARSGDAAARDELFTRIYPRLQRIAHWSMTNEVRLRRPWLAALFSTGDVVQDVCQRVLAELHTFEADSERALMTYLGVAVRNRLYDVLRFHEAVRRDCRRAIGVPEDLDLRASSPGPATQVLNEDLLTSFWRVAAQLPPREQELLRLRAHGERTFDEVALQLDYPSADAARKALYAAQARLLILLRRAGLAPGASQ